jgi:hypothetical protein
MNIIDIVEKFKPIFVLHEDEKYLPLSFETYVKGCELVNKITGEKLVEYPNLTVQQLTDPSIEPSLNTFKPNKNISLVLIDMKGESKFGTPLNTKVDIYVFINNVELNGIRYVDIIYNVLYGYNGIMFDNHIFDSEFVTVRILEDELMFNNMFFSQHGGGSWTSDVDFLDGRPIVFVAKGSHSNWSTKGKHIRYLGFGNDYCTEIKEQESWSLFDPNVVILTSEFQQPFPALNFEYMSFVGSLSQDFSSNITCYDARKIDSLSYKRDLGSETSEISMQSKVKFNIEQMLTIILILLSSFFLLCLNVKELDIEELKFFLSFVIGFVSAYYRLFP